MDSGFGKEIMLKLNSGILTQHTTDDVILQSMLVLISSLYLFYRFLVYQFNIRSYTFLYILLVVIHIEVLLGNELLTLAACFVFICCRCLEDQSDHGIIGCQPPPVPAPLR